MDTELKYLFAPYELKGHHIKNRIVMAPMELLIKKTRDGFVNEDHLNHYGERARSGIGLVIIEATSVDPRSMNVVSQLGAWSDEHIPGLRRLAAACQRYGAKVLLQLQHLGVRMKQDPIGPSAYQDKSVTAREMKLDELKALQEAYVSAIRRAELAGFDGVELHGAHGYMLNQFSSPNVNQRTDRYGGTLDNRLRFVQEVMEQAQPLVNERFIFGYRMGCNQPTLEDGVAMAVRLEQMGIDVIHVSSCGYSGSRPELPTDFPYNWVIYGGSRIREKVTVPVIVVYEIRTPERADDIVKQGYGDFAAIGRELIVDAEWARKAADGDEIRYCIRCQPCVIFNGENCVML
ncbi:NADH:flavin oxidoreductase [Paenibacillus daejeonensis]|uniref:oxidoreductase n=1 Tax=Paenibacillus daejeonensis TaxID=135193 RepID=UPI0003745058|nr:NADH:flavin oxidoreductase [Paenibacillus daejeonensis]